MTDASRPWRLASVLARVCVLVVMFAPGAAFASSSTIEDTNDPESTEPATTEPPVTQPPSTEPPVTGPPSSEPATTVPATGAADDTFDAAAIIGTIGFIVLLAISAWWMVRRNDTDDAPHPRRPELDEPLPGQDLV